MPTVKNVAIKIAKKNVFLRKIMRTVVGAGRRLRYFINTCTVKVDDRTVLFNAFNGKSYSCTPKAVYEYMLTCEEFCDYRYIWVVRDLAEYAFLTQNPNTTLVIDQSKQYERALGRAKYWICNYRIYDHIIPKKRQIYVQCWHGTPLKRLGYDIENSQNAMNSLEEIREKYRTDAARFAYILSPSAFASDKFASAWNLNETGQRDKVIEIGYPRNDYLYHYTPEDISRIKKNLGIPEDKKVLLYAPTWRDNQHTAGVGYVYSNTVDFEKMQQRLGGEWVVLFRAHYLVANSFDFGKFEGFVYDASEYMDINELYVISDMLMTDYSSVFFDYANLKRPILFYMYDLQYYASDLRGFYLDLTELPGPIIENEDEMIERIADVNQWFVYDDIYKRFNETYNYLDDGNASERFVHTVIGV